MRRFAFGADDNDWNRDAGMVRSFRNSAADDELLRSYNHTGNDYRGRVDRSLLVLGYHVAGRVDGTDLKLFPERGRGPQRRPWGLVPASSSEARRPGRWTR